MPQGLPIGAGNQQIIAGLTVEHHSPIARYDGVTQTATMDQQGLAIGSSQVE